jgi:hypothetical protein
VEGADQHAFQFIPQRRHRRRSRRPIRKHTRQPVQIQKPRSRRRFAKARKFPLETGAAIVQASSPFGNPLAALRVAGNLLGNSGGAQNTPGQPARLAAMKKLFLRHGHAKLHQSGIVQRVSHFHAVSRSLPSELLADQCTAHSEHFDPLFRSIARYGVPSVSGRPKSSHRVQFSFGAGMQ